MVTTSEVGPEQDVIVEDVTTEEQISRNQDERDEARQNLHDTLTEVNAKVEQTGQDLRPDHLVRSHPAAASVLAAGLGFLLGSMVRHRGPGPIVIAAVLGLALSMRLRSAAENDSDRENFFTD